MAEGKGAGKRDTSKGGQDTKARKVRVRADVVIEVPLRAPAKGKEWAGAQRVPAKERTQAGTLAANARHAVYIY